MIVQADSGGYNTSLWYDVDVSTGGDIGRAAGKLVKNWMPAAKHAVASTDRVATQVAKQWVPTARQSGAFVKHVLPAAVKPIHSLWHEILGFVFLVFAGIGAYKIWRHPGTMPPEQLIIVVVFVIVMAAYGLSSIRKARRISRS